MLRPSSALEMTPAVVLEIFVWGLQKFTWFRMLKISARNSTRAGPIGNRLLTEKSTCCVPGPRIVLRPAVPCLPASGTAYAATSNQCVCVGLSRIPNAPAVTRLTRCGKNDPHAHTFVELTLNGNPLANRATPCTCQPPSTYASAPPSERYGLPCPNGSSYPKLNALRCR